MDGEIDLGLAAAAAAALFGAGSHNLDSCFAAALFVDGDIDLDLAAAAAADRELNLCRRGGGGCGISCDTVKLCGAVAAAGCGGAIGCDKVNL